jgi:putative redox protein
MTDKSKLLTTSIVLLNEKLHFEGKVSGNAPLSIDYTPPLGDNLGYTSLELLLLSLSSCMSSSILVFLRKMKKSISGFEMIASGTRNETHPTGFKSIILDLTLKSEDTSMDELDKIIKLSEETYCPVWSMLKGNVEIEIKKTLVIN